MNKICVKHTNIFIIFCTVGLFLSTIVAPKIMGLDKYTSLKLMLKAFLYSSVLFIIFSFISLPGFSKISKKHISIFNILFILAAVSTISFVYSFFKPYDLYHVIGDYFRFVIPFCSILLLYLFSYQLRQEDKDEVFKIILSWAQFIFLIFCIVILFLYFCGVLNRGHRPTGVWLLPFFIIISYWLKSHNYKGGKFGYYFFIIAFFPFIYFCQSLGLILRCVLIVSLTMIFYHGIRKFVKRMLSLLIKTGVVGLLFFPFLHMKGFSFIKENLLSGYLGYKLKVIFGKYGIYKTLVEIGGSRIVEPVGIIKEIQKHGLLGWFFGAGMGSTFGVTNPFGVHKVWEGVDHFVHNGFWEVILRTGIIGGILYFLLSVMFFKYSWKVRKVDYITALACALATINLFLLPLSGKWFLGPKFFPYFLFVYVMLVGERRTGLNIMKEEERNA